MTNLQWIQFYEFGKPPMTDIVERLREPGNFEEGPFLMAEAADENERLQRAHEQWRRDYREACAEIERLRLKVPDRDKLLAEIERLRVIRYDEIAEMKDMHVEIERLREHVAALQLVATSHEPEVERLRAESDISDGLLADAKAEIERLRAALQSLTKDPPPSLAREPDTDAEVIIKMREIARRALTSPTIARPAGR